MTEDLAKHYVERGMRNPQLIQAALAINEDRLHEAEPILRTHLKADPLDVAAIRLMAQLAARVGRYKDSETLLRRALELAPGFIVARSNLAGILYRQNRFEESVATLNEVLAADSDDVVSRNLKAAALGRIGDYDEALALYEELTRRFPDHAKLWMSYGHMLKTVGRQDDSIAAYRRALEIQPKLGEVWWSLANLKTVKFDAEDLAAMQAALASSGLPDEDRFHLDFALGKAFDDAREPERAFGHYAAANRLRREALDYDADIVSNHVDKVIARFTPDFIATRQGQGNSAPYAIFILGMPRAGSTLIEQILSSHSAIEGTMELPDLPAIALREGRGGGPAGWTDAVADMPPERLAELGAEFIERTRIQRKTDKPYFIDKLPNNWIYTGLIHLILPNAKIIDARRHPLDCCFSNFRQHFAKGQAFSYDLTDMGRYYADYVRAMAHIDAVLPGRVHRVIHEALVENPEAEVRALLNYLGLPFEDACLNFHQNTRAVRTASSEQVRRPLNRDGMQQWKPYEAWLGPLKDALGDLWQIYPAIR
jgi:tetratricopeptide (TPR) repeat protein